ncbi:unnamed protein product [Leptosia nina]|uniref:Uncharacterized protein n=1 Tax=Leptosia nina TaxID=320188 RepID=A0AAV1JKU4_9NEOP
MNAVRTGVPGDKNTAAFTSKIKFVDYARCRARRCVAAHRGYFQLELSPAPHRLSLTAELLTKLFRAPPSPAQNPHRPLPLCSRTKHRSPSTKINRQHRYERV